ncbi:Hsp70 family protein, partial [Candidatus Dojkabacteria bacterium]|nr:Hsp70 family protein [Candidatus Dojkabacteria bacterium]
AIQGAVLAGDESVQDITLLDVTPLSLGIEVNYGEMHVLIPRNTTIPTEKSEDRFTTAADNQTAVDIKVLQGERPMAADNKVLGTFRLEGIPPAPRGVPQFEVIFKIDANGILNVSAKDKATNKEQSITITASTQLDEGEVERLVKEAAENATKDKERQEHSKTKNEADTLIYQTEKLIKDDGDKLSDTDKKQLTEESGKLKEMISKDDFDVEAVKQATESFMHMLQEITSKMYQQAAADADKAEGAEKAPDAKAEEGEVVEGKEKEGK